MCTYVCVSLLLLCRTPVYMRPSNIPQWRVLSPIGVISIFFILPFFQVIEGGCFLLDNLGVFVVHLLLVLRAVNFRVLGYRNFSGGVSAWPGCT